MEFPPDPTRGELLGLFLVTLLGGSLVIWFALRLRGRSSPASKVFAIFLRVVGVLWLFYVGFYFAYPHNHHNTEWVRGWSNYSVDAVLGAVLWSALLFWWLRWRHFHVHPRPVV